jgi:hypothetical protein
MLRAPTRLRPAWVMLSTAAMVPSTWSLAGSAKAATLAGVASRGGDVGGDGRADIMAFSNTSTPDVAPSIRLPFAPPGTAVIESYV